MYYSYGYANGHLNLDKWLYQMYKLEIQELIFIEKILIKTPFICSFKYGHIDVAKCLFELSKIDGNIKINIHAKNEYSFM